MKLQGESEGPLVISDIAVRMIKMPFRQPPTVLVTLLISDTNSTAYPTFIYGLYLPYGPGVGLRGLGMAFSNINREGIKGMKGNRNVGDEGCVLRCQASMTLGERAL